MISVQELLKQQEMAALETGRANRQWPKDEPPQSEPPLSEQLQSELLQPEKAENQTQAATEHQWGQAADDSVSVSTSGSATDGATSPKANPEANPDSKTQPKRFKHLNRKQLQRRQKLGLLCLVLGYGCFGWALKDFSTTPPFLWLLLGGAASFWGVERARQWHGLLPAMVSALALVSVLLPIWVLGLLIIPIVGLFGCVLLIKGNNWETALLSSLFVYALSAVAASVGALGLGLMGANAHAVLLEAVRIVVGFGLLSLFTALHRRRFYGQKGHSPAVRFALRAGLLSGLAGLGCAASFGLAQVDWPTVVAMASQSFQ